MSTKSPSHPWDAVERVDARRARAILQSQFPALAKEDIRYLAEGWDFTVFAVGDERLVRFPKRKDTMPRMAWEAAVLDALGGRVPAPLPSDRLIGKPSALFPFPFVGYRRLPGVPLDTLPLDAVSEDAACRMAKVVGKTLRGLHALPANVLPPSPDPTDDTDDAIPTALEVLGEITGRLPATTVDACHKTLAPPPPPALSPVVAHRDLGPEHLLVDPKTHALTGIIDWSDAGLGDRAADFVGLWVELGEPGLHAALDAYGDGSTDAVAVAEAIQTRVRFHGTRWLLQQVRVCDEGWRPDTRERWIHHLARRQPTS